MASIYFEPATGTIRDEPTQSVHPNYRLDAGEREMLLAAVASRTDGRYPHGFLTRLKDLERAHSKLKFGNKSAEERAESI